MPGMNMMNNHPNPDDQEAAMARADLYKLANYSFKLFKMIRDGDQLEGWVQAKVTKAADYIASVYHYMEYEMKFSEYGSKLENSDVYTESVKKQYLEKLTEARAKLEKLKKQHEKEIDETSVPQNPAKTKKHPVYPSRQLPVKEALKGGQKKLDVDKDGKLEKSDFAKLRAGVAEAEKKGLYYYVNKRKKAGTSRSASHPDAPSPQDWKNAAKTAKKEGVAEGSKPDFLDMDKDGNKKEPMKKAVADKKVKEEMNVGDTKKTRTGELTKTDTGVVHKRTDYSDDESGEVNKTHAKAKSAAEKKSEAPKQKQSKTGTWGMKDGEKFDNRNKKVKETAIDEASHQEKTTMKHVKDPTPGEKKAAKDIKPGIKGYSDRVAMLKSAEKDGRLKEVHSAKQQAAIAIAKKKAK